MSVKVLFKTYRKFAPNEKIGSPEIIDAHNLQHCALDTVSSVAELIPPCVLKSACEALHPALQLHDLAGGVQGNKVEGLPGKYQSMSCLSSADSSGLRIIPALVPREAQVQLLSNLLHECLADSNHRTNVHLTHNLPYHACRRQEKDASCFTLPPYSFFNIPPDSPEYFLPHDKVKHKTLNITQFLSSKLRWMTLGGQYDWSEKRYPVEGAPPFPPNIARFINSLFPEVRPEAAIMNIYNPGDYLSMHRDVSEQCDNPLVSISIGCDALFMAALEPEPGSDPQCKVFRLHSGDAVYLSGPSRFAWHGVPHVIANTCPKWLQDWPVTGSTELGESSAWRGWMRDKRINLSVRQIGE